MEIEKDKRANIVWSFLSGVVVTLIVMTILFKVILDDVKSSLIEKNCIEYDSANGVYVWARYQVDMNKQITVE